MSDMRIGKFTVLGQLGAGAHSSILHIRREEDSANYALKVVSLDGKDDQKYLLQAQHEFRVAQMLDHDNLIKVHALELVKDWLFRIKKVHLLIEFVNGKTLDTCPRLKLSQQVQVFKLIADGLCHMHRRKVFHADLKPNNVMLSQAGEVKILDYGLSWIKGEEKGRVQGTPEYMAPEQARQRQVNERTDIYNFGATMYRVATLRLPPSAIGEDGTPVDSRTWQRQFKPVAEANHAAPPVLCELITNCLAYNPHQRPETMAQVQNTLDKLADDMVRGPDDALDNVDW